ncbi:MAG TPA: hypothetical protein VHV78_12040, partial [Gemmatimonadaceae bacterium]|nr:hypothetical protein [Gemmatimonadaceae bacterium]
MRRVKRTLIAVLIAAAPVLAARTQSAPALETYLKTVIGLDDGQLADVRGGQAITKVLHTALDRDVTVFGIVLIHAPLSAYETRLRDSTVLPATQPQVFGIFHDPITAADAANLVLDNDEYKDLKSCRPNDCKFKLPASSMTDFTDRVNWDSRYAKSQVDSIVHSYAQRF